MPNDAFDQEAWLARIGYDGPITPTLDGLHRLIAAHAYAIAYESLDIMLGRTPQLDLVSLQNKMIARDKGGYCLEQNMLFRAGLRHRAVIATSSYTQPASCRSCAPLRAPGFLSQQRCWSTLATALGTGF
jgi:N-hydroxyarylamine O-acetyltransferase